MEDSLSVKSNESVATSEEFDFVGDKPTNKTPTLDIKGDLSELKSALTEVLQESGNMEEVENKEKKIGHSTFYGCLVEPGKDPLSIKDEESPGEKQDSVKQDSNEEEEGEALKSVKCFCGNYRIT